MADDCWFKLPLLAEKEIAELTGLPSLKFLADKKTKYRHFSVSDDDRKSLTSAYTANGGEKDTDPNNLLSLATESCAVLATSP